MARNGIDSFTRGKGKIVPQFSAQEKVLAISTTVDKTTYLNKPNMKIQGTDKLLCGITFIVAPCISMIHIFSHTNLCTCIIYY
jgi:hypothetical protein